MKRGLLLVSFGGPESPEEVMPFLEGIVQGKNVPRERLEEVAHHYEAFGGVSPINDACRALIESIQSVGKKHDQEIEIFWGNRHLTPTIDQALEDARDAGYDEIDCLITSGYSSYSSCRQYRENIAAAQERVENAPKVKKLRHYFNHPIHIEILSDSLKHALENASEDPDDVRIVFTAHSLPLGAAKTCEYERQLEEVAGLVAERFDQYGWQLVYQSRSGPPKVPWLEPDILEHLEAVSRLGAKRVVVMPIGFLLENMELLWDLDTEAKELAKDVGLKFNRLPAAGSDPRFGDLVWELMEEKRNENVKKRSLGTFGLFPSQCSDDCCPRPKRRPSSRPPTPAEA